MRAVRGREQIAQLRRHGQLRHVRRRRSPRRRISERAHRPRGAKAQRWKVEGELAVIVSVRRRRPGRRRARGRFASEEVKPRRFRASSRAFF